MPFIFYDTETTGTRTAFDQILQFAAIKTDDALNALDTFNVRCRLLGHVVPSPEALLVTGVSIRDITNCPLSHFDMVRQIRSKMAEWSEGGAIFMGWNSIRFDEPLLRQAYYQSLLPIYQTNTGGNGRADVMKLCHAVSACAPGAIAVPLQNGKPSFKLGNIAAANGVVLDNAHEALADTGATLAVARLMRDRAPALWARMIANGRKRSVEQLLRDEDVLLLSENHFGNPFNYVVAPLAPNAESSSEWAVFDLAYDPASYLDADVAEIRELIEGKVKIIRRTRTNSHPALLPFDLAPDSIRGGRQSTQVYRSRAAAIRGHARFQEKVSRARAARREDQAVSAHVEERIYEGFPSDSDAACMQDFHAADWAERVSLIARLEDARSRELGERVIAAERPDVLTAARRRHWETWRRKRLFAEGDVPWLTVPNALNAVAALSRDATAVDRSRLAAIKRYLDGLA